MEGAALNGIKIFRGNLLLLGIKYPELLIC
jgi:hypothetical protein